MLAGSIANAKLTNSSITFGSTAQALGSTVSAFNGVIAWQATPIAVAYTSPITRQQTQQYGGF
jgi:hypothetical protein